MGYIDRMINALTGRLQESAKLLSTTITWTGTHTNSGTQNFTGAVAFTGTKTELGGHRTGQASAMGAASFKYTLAASRDAGKVLIFTSGGAGSRHIRIVLPQASTMTGGASGTVYRIVNGYNAPGSSGIFIQTSAHSGRHLDGSSRPLRSTSRIGARAGGITLCKVRNRWITLDRNYGQLTSSVARTTLTWMRV